MALARAERERRSARARTARERRFGLLGGERPGEGLRRIALGQLDIAIELLEGDPEGLLNEHSVHETRKSLKRLRALITLLEGELGARAVAHENALLRGAGLRLAGARDAEVMVVTLDRLCKRHPHELAERDGVLELRRALVAERTSEAERASRDSLTRASVLAELRAARDKLAALTPSRADGIDAVEPGLRRLYRQGRRRLRRAERGRRDGARAMHQWRKRVKDLRYAAEMLDRAGAEDDAHLRRLARKADELAELLGEEHDLALLADRVRAAGMRRGAHGSQRGRPALGKRTRKKLLKLIARRRKRLRRLALRDGRRLYRQKPRKFVRRVAVAYTRASRA